MRTRSATYPDRETAQWATQQVVTANEQLVHRWLAQSTRSRLTIEASWPSRSEPAGRVLLQAMMLAGQEPLSSWASSSAAGSRRTCPASSPTTPRPSRTTATRRTRISSPD
ncbi:hypothetical protein ACFQ9Z_04310 [Streptomyces sp. NPDC056580]|uniref:hypothetical protein n=1 Tax=Streptomyces sp. NPDC056580 TaxID=3345872 RepID=UPI00367F8A1B